MCNIIIAPIENEYSLLLICPALSIPFFKPLPHQVELLKTLLWPPYCSKTFNPLIPTAHIMGPAKFGWSLPYLIFLYTILFSDKIILLIFWASFPDLYVCMYVLLVTFHLTESRLSLLSSTVTIKLSLKGECRCHHSPEILSPLNGFSFSLPTSLSHKCSVLSYLYILPLLLSWTLIWGSTAQRLS